MSLLSGCSGNAGDTLPPVVTHGIPDEKVKSTVVADGFTVDIHSTYAEIKSYTGKDVSVTVPESAAGVTVKLIGEGAFRNNAKIVKVPPLRAYLHRPLRFRGLYRSFVGGFQ